jgi:hypothetical protein
VLAVEVVVRDRLYERQRALASVLEKRLDPSEGLCAGVVSGQRAIR